MKNLILNYLNDNNIEVPENFELLEVYELEEMFEITYDQIDNCYIDESDSIYCEKEDIITHEYNAFYCEYSESSFTTKNYNAIEVYYRYNRTKVISSYFEDDLDRFEIVQIHNGDLYERAIVNWVESEGEYYPADDCYYWESDDEYHLEPEPIDEEDTGDYNFNYHGSNPAFLVTLDGPKIGFEVEKEDRYIKEKYRANYLQKTTGWGKENDGSLDSVKGFELVSPVFSLHESKDYFINEFNKVKELLDADFSHSTCGGHINYSHPDFRQVDLLNAIKGYLPLLYALYPHRINQSYCRAKNPADLINHREKYQSVCIKDRCIEFRIFGAVKSMENLLWRLELTQIIDSHKTEKPSTVLLYMSDESHPLYKHLTKIYNHERLSLLIERFEKYSKQFHNVYLDSRLLKEIDNRLTIKIIKEKSKLY